MKSNLKKYFPMIREREELLREIQEDANLWKVYSQLGTEIKEEFLDFCTGMRGAKILRDSFFKEVINPEYNPGVLEDLLCVFLGRKVKIVRILPNDSTRISDETSLLITDIIVELEDGSLANVEIQKIGYAFPGQRSACYSADMLLRQYKRVRSQQGKQFDYKQIKTVYLIVIYEKSPKEFHKFPNTYFHHAQQSFDSGLEMDLLQEYVMIPLDMYHKRKDNKPIETKLDAWLTFLSDDSPEHIIELINRYPEFRPMYEMLYQMCLNVEKVMNMFFSEELRILDRNTVQYMIDEQQREIDTQKKEIDTQKKEIDMQKAALQQKDELINRQTEELDTLRQELEKLREKV